MEGVAYTKEHCFDQTHCDIVTEHVVCMVTNKNKMNGTVPRVHNIMNS